MKKPIDMLIKNASSEYPSRDWSNEAIIILLDRVANTVICSRRLNGNGNAFQKSSYKEYLSNCFDVTPGTSWKNRCFDLIKSLVRETNI